MGEKRWTTDQRTAIDLRGRTLLVSAAAGSGKTAVLTQRIISRLTDPENPADISRMLVVTFTRAAASELKERISAALSEALASDPSDMRLAHQLVKLGSARISTIHSFCFSLIKDNFNSLGLSPGVRIADDAEALIMSTTVMDSLIDELYDEKNAKRAGVDFSALVRNLLSSDRDDTLAKTFLNMYKRVISYPEGVGYFMNCADELRSAGKESFFDTSYGRVIKEYMQDLLSHAEVVYGAAIGYFERDDEFSKKYLPGFASELEYIRSLSDMLKKGVGYAEFSDAVLSFKKSKLGGVKAENKTEESIYHCSMRDDIRDALLKKAAPIFFGCKDDELERIIEDTAYISEHVCRFLTLYEERLLEEKRKRSLVDYNDLERMAYALLVRDGHPTDIARECALELDEIYIDEYQDVNKLQDAIFSAIATNNRIMVGDIKQSIYAFRGAQPEVFNGYRDTLAKYGEGSDDMGNTIFLSDNFRCDSLIIKFMNTVCSKLFLNGSRGLSYSRESDDLRYAKLDDGHTESPAQVVLINTEHDNDAVAEAEYIAQRMLELRREGYGFGDMAVILRKKETIKIFDRVLRERGIPTATNAGEEFFERPEILLVMCILNSVDNPMRDVYLAGMMKSPFFAFTLDELIYIRSFERESSLYESVKLASREDSAIGEKCAAFLCKLDLYRREAAKKSAELLIRYIYEDLSMLAVAPGGESADNAGDAERVRRNLITFYNMARSFSSSSYFGLYNFLQYIDEKAAGENGGEATSEGKDAVSIISVHHSKGLEFPVCFLCRAGGSFNKEELKEKLIIGRECGIGIALKSSDLPLRYDTPLRRAAGLDLIESSIEEEMRVLYVALTRAKEKLIVTASTKDTASLISQCRDNAKMADRHTLISCKSFIEWILTALYGADDDISEYCTVETAQELRSEDIDTAEVKEQEDIEVRDMVNLGGMTADEYYSLFSGRFAFEYPQKHLAQLPSKLTVSKLYPGILDESDDGDQLVREPRIRPLFLEENITVSGAERGIATHVFMQFCDFDFVERNGIAAEIARLVSLGFITAEMAQRINTRHLSAFFDSALYKEMRKSEVLVREKRFNITVKAENFTESEETRDIVSGEEILVQGIIDCFFENGDGSYTLVDYKTDSFSYEDIKERPLEVKKELADRHRTQLSYYRDALERLSGRSVSKTLIYSFALGDSVEID